jgi:16S rRNA (cytosine1407-C5)-methyltransferase
VKQLVHEQKLAAKRESLVERTVEALQVSADEAADLLTLERRQSIRINTLKTDIEPALVALQGLGWNGEHYDFIDEGYTADEGLQAVRDSDLVANGHVMIQNAASWLPVLALNPQPGDSVLDMCAAPGGKTSHIAALTHNQANITANDNSKTRLAKLQGMTGRLGALVGRYTLYDARFLARKLEGQQFDKILLDAPCSGEGLMNLDRAKDFDTWSVAQVKRLQQLQKKLISQAWQLLKPGGTLVYSTCTIAPEENEAVVDYLLRRHTDANLQSLDFALPNRVTTVESWNGKQFNPDIQKCLRLKPSENIEAFFVARLEKSHDSEAWNS